MKKEVSKTNGERGAIRAKASTKDVLGGVRPSADGVTPKWRSQYKILVDLLNGLVSRRGELVRDASEQQPVFSLHMADAGTDQFDRDFALSLASSEQNLVYEIEQAINRIHNGSYGVCELTGKSIESERLKAIPWARFSAQAEKQLENEGAVRRPRLAPLEALPKTTEAEATQETEPEEE